MVVVSSFRALATSRWLAPLLLVGCLGGQTGTEEIIDRDGGGSPTTDNGSPCEDEEQPIAPDDASLGFSYQDVAGFVVGEHQTELAWGTGNPSVSFGPESGTSSLVLSIDSTSGVKRLHAVPPKQSGSGPAIAIGCPPDRLAADVGLRLTSGGGALAETVPARLLAASADRVELEASIPIEQLQGSFRVTLAPGFVTRSLAVRAVFTELGLAGELSGGVESDNGTDTSYAGVTYARFPAENPCAGSELAIPVTLSAPGASQLSGLLSTLRADEHALRWRSGTTTAIDFEVTPAPVACQSRDVVTGGTQLSLPVALAFSTADGRVDTMLAGSVAGDASGTSLRAARTCDGASPEEQLERCGLADFDTGGHTNLSLSLSATLSAEGVFRGSLDVLGIPIIDCPSTPNGACGSPGPSRIDGGEF